MERPAAETTTSERACLRCRELEQENETLSNENRSLKAQLRHLERRLERSERAGKRQAAPFSKGLPARKPRKPGRRPGSEYGTPGRRAVPEHVDETVEVPLPDRCPDCGGEVEARNVADQYQTELPPIRPHVTRFRIHLGTCRTCRKPVRGRHPRQTSDALGAAASQLGPRAVSVAAHLNKGLGLSFEKSSVLFDTVFGLPVTPSGLCQALDRMAHAAEPTYEALVQAVREAPVVSPDETGWKVGGELKWLWAFATPDLSVYAIQDGRGFQEAARILGADFAGVLVRDGWAPYRRFEEAEHQSCLAHLLRRCRQLIDASRAGAARFPHAVRRILQEALDLRDRYRDAEVSDDDLETTILQLEARLDKLLQGNIQHPPNRRFLKHLKREEPHLFTFLRNPDVEATNWWSEQAIRPAVVTRKVCGGNRTWSGAHTQEILASVLATAHKQRLNPLKVLPQIYCAPEPVIVRFDPAPRPEPP